MFTIFKTPQNYSRHKYDQGSLWSNTENNSDTSENGKQQKQNIAADFFSSNILVFINVYLTHFF